MKDDYPKYLYQYLKFDNNFIDNLKNYQLRFSDFNKFNDPHDCQIVYDYNNSLEEIFEYLNEENIKHTQELKKLNPIEQISYLRDWFNNRLNKEKEIEIINRINQQGKNVFSDEHILNRAKQLYNNPQESKEWINSIFKNEISNYRILCLSKTRNNNLMWSHYSDKHSGVCIKLNFNINNPFFSFPLEVEYVSQYPKYNYIREHKKSNCVNIIFHTKFLNWKYEQEIRIIKDIRNYTFIDGGLFKYEKDVLAEINFGLKSSDENIKFVKDIVSEYYDNKVIVNKAFPIEYSFV